MYKKVLIATDGSELGSKAVRSGMALAKAVGAQVVVVTVTEPWPVVDTAKQVEMGVKDPIGEYEALAAKGAEATLEAASQTGGEIGVSCEKVHVKNQHPATGILEAAGSTGADLIVMASHGRRGLSKMLLGSVAHEVLTKTTTPVLIIR